jgi:hypothetical protein
MVPTTAAAILFDDLPSSPASGMRLHAGDLADVWAKVGDVLRSSGLRTRVHGADTIASTNPPAIPALCRVSEGLLVTEQEYHVRFSGLPLDDYRRRMPPAVFEAYVRFVGLVPGDPRFDVVEAAAQIED